MKRSIFCSPKQFRQLARENEERKQEGAQAVEAQQVANIGFRQPADNIGAFPNIIGNLEDLSVNENSAAFFQKEPSADPNASAPFSQPSYDPSNYNEPMYTPLTVRKTQAQLQREADKVLPKMGVRGHSKEKKN